MEYVRGFIVPMMNFYGFFSQPSIVDLSDALNVWTNKFQIRELKVITSLVAGMLQEPSLMATLTTKELQLAYLYDYIYLLYTKADMFQDAGVDNGMCYRMKFVFNFDPQNPNQSIINFLSNFDIDQGKRCNLKTFLQKNSTGINSIIKDNNHTDNDGFVTQQKALPGLNLLQKSGITCHKCKKAGDSIIALLSPPTHSLEHTDSSFDGLCPVLGKPHNKHMAEITYHNNQPKTK